MERWSLRPVNGWRAFLGEVGVIILGVLIALSLESVAADIGWRMEASRARHAIGAELGEAVGQGVERLLLSPCIERRLDHLAHIVDRSAASGRLPPLGDTAIPPFRTWNSGTWDSTVNAQTAARLGREELNALAGAYRFIEELRRTNNQEVNAWTRLYAVVGPGRELTPAEATELRSSISEAKVTHRFMTLLAARLHQQVKAYELPIDQPTMRNFSERRPEDNPICSPMNASAPQTYGQAPFAGALKRVLEAPITREHH